MSAMSEPHAPCASSVETRFPCISPFDRIIALDYYDGLKGGLVRCSRCSAEYAVEMTGESEDDSCLRTWALALLPQGSFDRIVGLIVPWLGEPQWPFWFPIWNFGTDADRRAVSAEIEKVMSMAGRPAFHVTSDDLVRHLSSVVQLPRAPEGGR